jgi:hypothetical protein
MSCRWKRNWPETQANFRAWWHGRGLVLNLGDFPVTPPALAVADPGEAASPVQKHADAAWIAARCRAQRANRDYEHGDILPVAFVDWGTVSLAAYLGAEVELTPDTVWYHPRPGDPLAWGPLRFDPAARWFRIHEDIYRQGMQAAAGDFVVGQPGIGSNIEVLAALRGAEALMADLIERPEWVQERLWAINQAFFAAYQRVHEPSGCPTAASARRISPSGVRAAPR